MTNVGDVDLSATTTTTTGGKTGVKATAATTTIGATAHASGKPTTASTGTTWGAKPWLCLTILYFLSDQQSTTGIGI